METPSPYAPPSTDALSNKERDKQVRDCLVLLGAGKDQLSIINYLRKNGYNNEEAKKLSYSLFDEAKKKLMRSQILPRILANGSMGLGVLIALFVLVMNLEIDTFYLAAIPFCFGLYLRTKVVNPSRLP